MTRSRDVTVLTFRPEGKGERRRVKSEDGDEGGREEIYNPGRIRGERKNRLVSTPKEDFTVPYSNGHKD